MSTVRKTLKRRHQNTTNMIDSQRKCSKNNEADRYPPAYSGLVAGSSAVRTKNEINSCSEPCLRSRWALAPSIGEVPSSSERAACIAPNAEKFDNQNRGQLLSFLCAVAPNRTMSLQPPFHFGLA